MAQQNDGFKQMVDLWSQGQDAFLAAQKQAMEAFQSSLGATSKPVSAAMPGIDPDALAAWNSFISTWAPAWDPSAMTASLDGAQWGQQGRDMWMSMLDPSNWTHRAPEQLRKILEMVSQGPRFADLATPQIEAAAAWRETVDYQKAAADMASIMQDAWSKTYARYSEDFALEDLQSGDVEAALDGWLKAANEELLEVQHSQTFMDAQRRMMRASVEIKARQRDIAEQWAEAFQMPTRTEVDDLSRIVHELRRDLRAAKRELASLRADKA